MKVKGAQLVVRALRAEGVQTVFALAGDHTLRLLDLMAREGFEFIDTRHEQAAVDMANAWGRITGSPGVTMFTTPGHANAIPGLTLAFHLETPLINIAGCADQNRLGQGASQEIDQVGMARPVTKGAWFVSEPSRIPECFARAFRTALGSRRGPVHLTIPTDVQDAEVDEGRVPSYKPHEYRRMGQSLGDPARVREAIELLHRAERPMAIIGNGGHSVERQDLERFLEVTRIPLFTEDAARGIVSDSHPYCFGLADGRTNPVARRLRDADVVLLLGKKVDFLISFGGPPTLDPEVRIIQVEASADLIGVSRGVAVGVLGDIGPVVKQLAEEAAKSRWSEQPMIKELESAHRDLIEDLEARATETGPPHTMSVHKALRPFLDEDACLVFEGSDFAFYGAAYHSSPRPRRWFTNGTLGMIGWGVPFGIGAKAALPDSRVVVLTGDGAFGFNGMELDTAVRHNIPVVVVVGNDSVWGIDYHQQVRLFGKVVATELLPSRYDKVAEALGAHGEYVETAEQLPGALERAFASGRPAVVNVRTTATPSPLTEWIIETKGSRIL
ncbi:MAG: thiamine pyrophosphate-binding protein [Candidatus Methylomirabilia bacterium]